MDNGEIGDIKAKQAEWESKYREELSKERKKEFLTDDYPPFSGKAPGQDAPAQPQQPPAAAPQGPVG